MASKGSEVTITVTVVPGMSLWDAIKMRIAGKGSEVFWLALAKQITDKKDDPVKIE